MAYSQRFSLREELPSQQPEDISQSISHSAITLPKFVYLMSELGVAGPRQRGRLGLESSFYTYLGEGAQFQAYRHTEVEMVAKRITLSNMVASNSEQLLDLELEIRALADERVYEHPNIVDLLDWGYDVVQDLPREIRKRGDVKLPLLVPVLYVEPASEGSLKKFLESSRDWATRVRLCLDIAAGLECLRECQILHNDLKPENILIFGDGDAGPSFTAKLADFGHARASDGGRTLSFVGYGRTPKWKPPESEDYDSELHGDFHSEMLFKSESYAYGMLALYTLFSPPKDHPSSPKDQSWSPEGQNSSPFNRNRIKREEEITARIEDHEDTTLREDMIKTWRTVESNFLAEQPKDRHDVSPSELGLKGGLSSLEAFGRQIQRDSPRRTPLLFNTGWNFYRRMDAPLLGLLGKESSTELKDYPGDLLFGMALSKATSGDKGFHGEVKYLIHEAAHATAASVRAMAIWKSIDAAIPSKDPGGNENISFPTMPEVAAMPNLYESNSGKAVRVSDEFRRRGGYNRESALTSVFTCAEIEQKIIAATYSDNAILPVDLTIERKPGQRFSGPVRAEDSLLHLAAAFGVCEAITRLISNKHSNPVLDARNTQDETPLYKACMAGQYEAARELLRLGADSSLQVGRTKVTCLHWLFVFQPSRMKEIARALLLSGVSVDARVAPVISLRGQDTMVFEETTHYPFHWPMGTALHWAAHMESIEAVGHLIDHGAYVDEVDEVYVSDAQQSPALKTKKDQSQTALSMAMYRGSSLMVKYLLGRGAEPCRADGEGRTPLHMLAGDCWMQNRLFSIPLNIHQWCFHGNFEACVKALKTCIDAAKDKGASLDSGRKHQNLTPLMDAVQSKNVCAVIALLKAGANANICEDWSKNLPIHIWLTIEPDTLAYPEGYFVALEELLNNTVDITRSRTAVTNLVLDNHSPSWKKKLLTLRDSKHHIDINMQDDSGMSLLMTWISLKIPDLNYLEGVMWLLTNGADITIKDRFGRDFLFYAAENWEIGDEDCLGLLKLYTNHHAIIPQGTLLNGSKDDESGKTVLMAMCKNCYIQSAQFAIQNGIDVNAFDKDGRTALDVALESGNTMRLALLSGFMIHHADGRRQLPKESDDISEVDWYRAGFGDKHHESQSSHNSAAFIKARYMTFPRLRTLLVEAGAKTGKQLGQRTIAPDIKQSERDFVVESGVENFDPEQQPFYDLWKEAYRYDDTTEEEDAIRRREREGWSM